jgi:hypothetical protein
MFEIIHVPYLNVSVGYKRVLMLLLHGNETLEKFKYERDILTLVRDI